MSDSIRPRRDWNALIATAILVLTTWASGIAAFVATKERVETLTMQHAEKVAEDQRQDDRIRALETNRALMEQINDLRVRDATREADLRALREELARRRR